MLISLLFFEANYQMKKKAFIGFIIIFLAFGFMLGSQGFAPDKVSFNSAYQISYNIALTSLGSVFAIMFFTINGILRDRQHNFEAILYTTSLQKKRFFISRFIGVFISSLATFSMALFGFYLGTLAPWLNPDRIIPSEPYFYLWTWLIIVIPNVLVCTSIIFSVSALTKNNIATYTSAIVIYAAYFLCSIAFNSPLLVNSTSGSEGSLVFSAIGDPFGLSAFFEQTQFWTPYDKNNKLISFSGYFMLNRLLWLAFSILVLLITYKYFSFKKLNSKVKKSKTSKTEPITTKTYSSIGKIVLGTNYQITAFISRLKIELKGIFKSLPFIAILLIWVIIITIEISQRLYQSGSYNDILYPTTNYLISFIKDPLPFLGLLLVVFYSGELIWKERSIKFNDIIDTTPTSNLVFFLSKGLAVFLLPLILISISIIIAIIFQISTGYYHFELEQYFLMYYFLGIGFLFNTILAMLIQNIVSNKYLGMLIIGIVIIIFQSPLSSSIGIEHALLRLGKLPIVEYNNMNGYGDYARVFNFHVLYWMSLALIFTFLCVKVWQRGILDRFTIKLKRLVSNWKGNHIKLIVVLLLFFFVSGYTIYYNTNIMTEYVTKNDNLNFREGYEKNYRAFENLLMPSIVDVKTRVNLFPKERGFSIEANCILENTANEPITKVLIFERIPLQEVSIKNADLKLYDSVYGTYIFEFKQPLKPKEQAKFSYKIKTETKGFDINESIVDDGTYLMANTFEPALGYRKGIEITDAFERQKRGLPKQIEGAINDSHLQIEQQNISKVTFESIVSTELGQIAIAPGKLLKKWSESNRLYFHYKTEIKITPSIAYFSGKYTQKKEDHNGVSIEQYYKASHNFNVENIQQNCKVALDYCTENFGPYPFDHIRIAEIPGHWPFGGFAHPGTISMVEDKLYLIDYRDTNDFNLVGKRTIHEVAHQWFGHMLTPKNVAGASIFTEGLAKYVEAVVMEKEYGLSATRQLGATANRRYFLSRSFSSGIEPPLYQVKGQDYLAYGKSYCAMLYLRNLIGETSLNSTIKKMIDDHKKESSATITAMEFLNNLYDVTPQENHKLIDDWFKRIITYNLSIENSEVKKVGNSYEVSITVLAYKYEADKNGKEFSVSIDEPMQIGLFKEHPDRIKSKEGIISIKPYRITGNKITLKIITNEIPVYIAIDPYNIFMDKNLNDNILKL